MRRLKEQVKSKELSASEARERLEEAARINGDFPRVKDSKTWRWLARREANA